MQSFILISLFLLMALLGAPAAWGAEEQDVTPGYDENTEVTVKGTLLDLPARARGPVVLRVKSGSKTHQVMTGPRWYLTQEGITFTAGHNVSVTGSKFTGRDGSVYIVAKRIQDIDTGKEYLFRDRTCSPLWTGHGRGKGRMGR